MSCSSCPQLGAVLFKKALVFRRDKRAMAIGLLSPILACAFVLIFVLALQPVIDSVNASRKAPPALISYWTEGDILGYVNNSGVSIEPLLTAMTDSGFRGEFRACGDMECLRTLNNNDKTPMTGAFVVQSFDPLTGNTNYTSMIVPSVLGYSGTQRVIGLMNEALLLLVDPTSSGFSVLLQALPDNDEIQLYTYLGPVIMTYAFGYVALAYALEVIREREMKLKSQLLLSSLSLRTYWLGTLLGDLILFMVPAVISLIVFYAAGVAAYKDHNAVAYILLYLLFGIDILLLAYVLSFVFDKRETAQRYMSGALSIIIALPFLLTTFVTISADAQLALCLLPPFSLTRGLNILAARKTFSFVDIFSVDHDLFPVLLMMIAQTLIWSTLITYLEWLTISDQSCRDVVNRKPPSSVPAIRPEEQDEDVQEEAEFQGDNDAHVAAVTRFFKTGKREKWALRGITLGIRHGECFGMLGPNGAGKTTLLSLITGLQKPTNGVVTVCGHTFDAAGGRAAIYRSIGVCMQQDALFDNLTVVEHLQMYGRLRNMSPEERETRINELLHTMGLEEFRNITAVKLSGGTKRKLSVANALVGSPEILFLDEPSTAMDPATRRALWNIILAMKRERTVILTTHSMEEADALCDRIGIVVNGALRCLGTSQHLKNRYGAGYRLSVGMRRDKVEQFEEFMKGLFPNAELVSGVGGTRNYNIPQQEISLARVFTEMEANKKKYGINDYAVSQATLEQVFIQFAREQEIEEQR